MDKVCVAIDVMGGDFGPRITVPAAISSLAQYPSLHLILVGDQTQISALLGQNTQDFQDRLAIVDAPTTVGMDEKPASALRNKRESSMALAIDAVKSGHAQACLSAGNTGALMALSRLLLGMHAGIDRPAFITEIPTLHGHCHVLDLGANVNCTAENLFQFAVMGSIVSEALDRLSAPRVALLNVGQEEIKGQEQVKQAATLLSAHGNINYVGFVEGDHIFSDEADVIVCDGFVGNVALKTSEGLARMINQFLRQVFKETFLSRLIGRLSKPILAKVIKQIDPKRHNGASMLGLNGIVVKSHGNADAESFRQAIRRAMLEVEKDIPSLVGDRLNQGELTSVQ